jgi:hypothetical protein
MGYDLIDIQTVEVVLSTAVKVCPTAGCALRWESFYSSAQPRQDYPASLAQDLLEAWGKLTSFVGCLLNPTAASSGHPCCRPRSIATVPGFCLRALAWIMFHIGLSRIGICGLSTWTHQPFLFDAVSRSARNIVSVRREL